MKISNFTVKTLLCTLAFCSTAVLAQSPTTPPPATIAPASADSLPDAPSTTAHEIPPPSPTGPTVIFDTTMGRLTCKLFDKEAPITVANFVGLASGTKTWTDPVTLKKMTGVPFYDGTTFHRVIPGFMIQGGDRLGTGLGDAGYYIQDEITPALKFDIPGRLAMANSGPGTDGSQFFITQNATPQLDGSYTIFGQCDSHTALMVGGIALVDRNANDKPLTSVVMNKVTIVPDGQPIPPVPSTPAANPPVHSTNPSGGPQP